MSKAFRIFPKSNISGIAFLKRSGDTQYGCHVNLKRKI